MINKHSRSFRVRTLLAAALATALYAHHSLQIGDSGELAGLARRFQDAAIRLTRADPTTGRTATVIRQASFDPFCRPVAPGLSAESH